MHFFFADNHILSTILFTPLLGAIILLFVPRERAELHRWIGNIFGMLGLIVSLPLIWRFSIAAGTPRFQFLQDLDWIHSIGARYSLGIDGLSFLMVMLTTVLGAISILSSWSAIRKREKEYYILFLLLQTGMLGVFMSLDFVLFYVFWEVMLVPMYFLIGVWGSERRLYAAIKFFLYTLAGSVLMLLAILAIYSTAHTFSIKAILEAPHPVFSLRLERWLFWGFFFAFAIKVPMFPFHTWLPDAHTEAPTAGSVILAGVLLKMGTYGFLRFSLPMFPDATNQFRGIMIVLSIVAIVYGALVCMMQKDMKKLIAYSSVSHLGFCTLGIFALTPLGLQGSIIQQVNHGISTGALFLIVGVLYERRHTRLISEFGGLSTPMPNFAAIYMIITLSSLGMPLLNGFVGEFTILRGAFDVPVYGWRWAAWGVIGVILGAAYLLWLYQRVMFGNVTNEKNEKLPDLNLREYACLVPLVLLAFWIGIYPKPLFRVLEAPVQNVVQVVNPSALAEMPGYVPPSGASTRAPAVEGRGFNPAVSDSPRALAPEARLAVRGHARPAVVPVEARAFRPAIASLGFGGLFVSGHDSWPRGTRGSRAVSLADDNESGFSRPVEARGFSPANARLHGTRALALGRSLHSAPADRERFSGGRGFLALRHEGSPAVSGSSPSGALAPEAAAKISASTSPLAEVR